MNRRRYQLPLSIVFLNLILAVFPIIAGSLIYNEILDVVAKDLYENNSRILKQAMDSYEENYSNLGKTVFTLQETTSIIRLKNLELPYYEGNVIRLLECLDDYKLIMSNREEEYIIDSFLYFSSNDVVITPTNIFRSNDFFESQFGLSEGDHEKWVEGLKNTYNTMTILPRQEIIYQGKKMNLNLFIHSLWHDQSSTEVYFVALLNREFFINQLKGVDYGTTGSFTVISTNEVLFREGEDGSTIDELVANTSQLSTNNGYRLIKADNTDKLVSRVYSLLRKTSFILEQTSIDQISAVLGSIRRRVVFGGIAYVLAATLLSYFLTRRNRVTLMLSHSIAKQQLLNGLFSGTIVNREEMEKTWNRLKLTGEVEWWGMAHVAINPYESASVSELLMQQQIDLQQMQDTLSSLMGSFFTLHISDSQRLRLFLVHCFPNSDKAESNRVWKDDLGKLYEYFTGTLNTNLYIGCGQLQMDRMQLYISHAQARQALNGIARSRQPGIRQYVEEGDRGGADRLPENIFNILESYLFQGDEHGINSVFETFRSVLFDPQLSFVRRQYLISKIYGSVIEITERTGQLDSLSWSPEFFSNMSNIERIEELFIQLREKAKITSTRIVDKKKSHNTELLDQIIGTIQSNLDNQALNAAGIATTLDISESYLYQFFKEQTGTTFSSYLESRRMEKARQLLTETDGPVKEISAKVGYGSSNTFGRAFKRNFAMSAGKFRAMWKENH